MGKAVSDLQENRYERKFAVSTLTKYEIESLVKLHPAAFSEAYPERCVNNLYFDSSNMGSYAQSLDGEKKRVKIRIRWYGDLMGVIEAPVVELKIKEGLVGRKERFSLVPFALGEPFQPQEIANMIATSDLPEVLRLELMSLEVFLLNRYRRRYFLSANQKFRLTLDSELEFFPIRARVNPFLQRVVDDVTTVVELKYDPDADEEARWITSRFPFRLTKSSKYVTGIETSYLW